jgi:1,4-alpha-glucan branching enzyme
MTALSLLARLRHNDPAVRGKARAEVIASLERHGGDARAAAAELGISARTVLKWLAEPRAPRSTPVTTPAKRTEDRPGVGPGAADTVVVPGAPVASPEAPRVALSIGSIAPAKDALDAWPPRPPVPAPPVATPREQLRAELPSPAERARPTVLRFPAAPQRSPFADFGVHHRSPLGAQEEPAVPGMPAPARVPGPPESVSTGAGGAAAASAAASTPAPAAAIPARPAAVARGAALAAAPVAAQRIAIGEWPHHQPDAALLDDVAPAAEPAERRLAFVLHAHLPWVLGHGRWPHGEDWLAEAVAHCYLPLVVALRRLADRGGRHLMTVSPSPVLAAQLADQRTGPLVVGYLEHRRQAARDLAAEHPLAAWWESTYDRLLAQWHEIDGDLVGALRALAEQSAIELSTCAATHGYLPLLHRPEHVALQLAAARHNHRRWFGRDPHGLWMPECAYRPGGAWRHPATGAEESDRPGNEAFLTAAGIRWTVVDAHLLLGGEPLSPYPELWGAVEEREGGRRPLPLEGQGEEGRGVESNPGEGVGRGAAARSARGGVHSRLQPQRIGESAVVALPREPHTAHQVWSRHGGYPGDPRYLDFHKRHGETGLRLWSVTDAAGDLGDKLPYHPGEAMDAVRDQARHFPELLAGIAGLGGGVAICPYDAELFGHWWFEGVAWLEEVLASTLESGPITTTTPSRELVEHPPAASIALHEGSWGEEGDHRVWVNPSTTWMWEDLRLAEEAVARSLHGLSPARARAALAQLLLLAASDWPFLVTTGTAADYASERFHRHRDRLYELLDGRGDDTLPPFVGEDLAGFDVDPAWWRDDVIPTQRVIGSERDRDG